MRRSCSPGGTTLAAAAVVLDSVCPVKTSQRISPEEVLNDKHPDIRAYKLGKKRWSYNQCELVLLQEGATRASELTVVEASQLQEAAEQSETRGSQVSYRMKLSNDHMLQVAIFVVHSQPREEMPNAKATVGCASYQWTCVSRRACKKGCEGPVLRTLQRFGALGRRSNGPKCVDKEAVASAKRSKNARYMYLSIDEAGTHVGVKRFRLIAGVYDESGEELLGTACCPPIRVLSNNDVPGGAAHITLAVTIRKDWAGWVGVSGPCRTLWPTEEAPPAFAQSNSPLPQDKICQSIPDAASDEIKQGSRVLMPSADEELQCHIRQAQAIAAARDPRLPVPVSSTHCRQPVSSCWSSLGYWQGAGKFTQTSGAQAQPQLQPHPLPLRGPHSMTQSSRLLPSPDGFCSSPLPCCSAAAAKADTGGSQHAEPGTSAPHAAPAVGALATRSLSLLHGLQPPRPWLANSTLHQGCSGAFAGQEFAALQPFHVDSLGLTDHDPFQQGRLGLLSSPIHPFFCFPSPGMPSSVLQPQSQQVEVDTLDQELETHGSRTSADKHADPSFGTCCSSQQQHNQVDVNSSDEGPERLLRYDKCGADEESQHVLDAYEPESSVEDLYTYHSSQCKQPQIAGLAHTAQHDQQMACAGHMAKDDSDNTSLQEFLVSLAKGQGERMKKLKRKVSWHTDQLRQEKARVASIERDLTSTNQELEELRTQVTQLQRVCSTPAVGMTSSLQLQAFGKHEPQPVLQQENQGVVLLPIGTRQALPAPPPGSLPRIRCSLFPPDWRENAATDNSANGHPTRETGNKDQYRS